MGNNVVTHKVLIENEKGINKTNKKFMLLSVLGILFVVIGHEGDVHVFFNNIFPFYSFHIALFAFISGYFFKDKNTIDFLKHKTKKLIFIYLLWNFIYGIIICLFKKINLQSIDKPQKNFDIFLGFSHKSIKNVIVK